MLIGGTKRIGPAQRTGWSPSSCSSWSLSSSGLGGYRDLRPTGIPVPTKPTYFRLFRPRRGAAGARRVLRLSSARTPSRPPRRKPKRCSATRRSASLGSLNSVIDPLCAASGCGDEAQRPRAPELNVPDPIAKAVDVIGKTWFSVPVKIGALAGPNRPSSWSCSTGRAGSSSPSPRTAFYKGSYSEVHPTLGTPGESQLRIGIVVAIAAAPTWIDVLGEHGEHRQPCSRTGSRWSAARWSICARAGVQRSSACSARWP